MQAKILVLDDDVNILAAFEKFFRQEHSTMVAATTPGEALRALEEHSIDLLITDVRLNSQSGVTFFLKAKALYPQLPVIVITGYHESVAEQDLHAMGVNYLLLKPLDLEKLRAAVHHCLAMRTSRNKSKPIQPRFQKEGDL